MAYTLIELDECGEPRNGEVQQILRKLTGRATVPNVIVAAKSIGGGNELANCSTTENSSLCSPLRAAHSRK